MENTLNGEIRTKSVYISVNNNTNLKKNSDSVYLHYMVGWIKPKNRLTLLSLSAPGTFCPPETAK
jgi:hypothetical protein